MLKSGDRFETFVLSIDSIHKCINKIKQDIISDTNLKGVHTLWLYEFLKNPEGLTAAQLAAKSNIDRSLVSREVSFLIENGYISLAAGAKKRGYNTRLQLTDRGMETAKSILRSARSVQDAVGEQISIDELMTFYSVLSRISKNLDGMSKNGLNEFDDADAATS